MIPLTVGFFDSGIGGLSVLEMAASRLPHTEFLFYADEDNLPYGKKTKEEIINYVDEAVRFLREHGADVVVLACNTATSASAMYLREKYDFPILGMEPAVKVATKNRGNGEGNRIVVTATNLTLKLEKLERLIEQLGVDDCVDELSLQELVTFAENGVFDGVEVEQYLKKQLNSCDLEHTCSIVLGCTHFTFFKTLIKEIVLELSGKTIPVIDGNAGTVNYLKTFIKEDASINTALEDRIRLFESGREVPITKYLPILNRAHYENAGGC